jgi:hypothetical protein
LTTEELTAALDRDLPAARQGVDFAAWIDGPGVPAGAPVASSRRIEAVEALAGRAPEAADAAKWTPIEWQLYLEAQPRPAPAGLCEALDDRFHLTRSGNYEVLVSWLELGLSSSFPPARARTEEVLGAVGRMKYLRPLYTLLARVDKEAARRSFARFRDRYHPIARATIDGLLK